MNRRLLKCTTFIVRPKFTLLSTFPCCSVKTYTVCNAYCVLIMKLPALRILYKQKWWINQRWIPGIYTKHYLIDLLSYNEQATHRCPNRCDTTCNLGEVRDSKNKNIYTLLDVCSTDRSCICPLPLLTLRTDRSGLGLPWAESQWQGLCPSHSHWISGLFRGWEGLAQSPSSSMSGWVSYQSGIWVDPTIKVGINRIRKD